MTSKDRTPSLVIMGLGSCERVYGAELLREIAACTELLAPPLEDWEIARQPELLSGVEVIFSGWGMPRLSRDFLDAAPRLRAVFYAAGTIRSFMTEAAWERGIAVSSAAIMNAIPVAEFSTAAISLGLKSAWRHIGYAKRRLQYAHDRSCAGGYRSTVGLVSLGLIGQLVAKRLQSLDVRVVAHDPFCAPELARSLGVELAGLEEVFRIADVVSLHTPLLESTRGMITGDLIRSMKPNATLVNTARGAVIDEPGLIGALLERQDLCAMLDVTCEEPLPPESPLWEMPNVILTPHIAGAMAGECRRMGQFMVDEFRRWAAGQPMQGQVNRASMATTA